jgi:thioredoxin 1
VAGPEILTRIIISTAIVGFGIALYWIGNQVILARSRRHRRGLEVLTPGVPGILYFTTPDCVPCRTRQRPALQQLQTRLGQDFQIIQVDATEKPDLADYWGVLSVPTTFIIDSRGRPRRVNHGVQSAEDLYKQIKAIEAKPRFLFSGQGVIK